MTRPVRDLDLIELDVGERATDLGALRTAARGRRDRPPAAASGVGLLIVVGVELLDRQLDLRCGDGVVGPQIDGPGRAFADHERQFDVVACGSGQGPRVEQRLTPLEHVVVVLRRRVRAGATGVDPVRECLCVCLERGSLAVRRHGGLPVIARIRLDGGLREPPVVSLTGHPDVAVFVSGCGPDRRRARRLHPVVDVREVPLGSSDEDDLVRFVRRRERVDVFDYLLRHVRRGALLDEVGVGAHRRHDLDARRHVGTAVADVVAGRGEQPGVGQSGDGVLGLVLVPQVVGVRQAERCGRVPPSVDDVVRVDGLTAPVRRLLDVADGAERLWQVRVPGSSSGVALLVVLTLEMEHLDASGRRHVLLADPVPAGPFEEHVAETIVDREEVGRVHAVQVVAPRAEHSLGAGPLVRCQVGEPIAAGAGCPGVPS